MEFKVSDLYDVIRAEAADNGWTYHPKPGWGGTAVTLKDAAGNAKSSARILKRVHIDHRLTSTILKDLFGRNTKGWSARVKAFYENRPYNPPAPQQEVPRAAAAAPLQAPVQSKRVVIADAPDNPHINMHADTRYSEIFRNWATKYPEGPTKEDSAPKTPDPGETHVVSLQEERVETPLQTLIINRPNSREMPAPDGRYADDIIKSITATPMRPQVGDVPPPISDMTPAILIRTENRSRAAFLSSVTLLPGDRRSKRPDIFADLRPVAPPKPETPKERSADRALRPHNPQKGGKASAARAMGALLTQKAANTPLAEPETRVEQPPAKAPVIAPTENLRADKAAATGDGQSVSVASAEKGEGATAKETSTPDVILSASAPDAKKPAVAPPEPLDIPGNERLRQRWRLMQKLRDARIIEPDDDIDEIVATKVAAFMNVHPAVEEKGDAFRVTTREVLLLLQRPNLAVSEAAWTVTLTAYRIWQTVDRVAKRRGGASFTLEEFWDEPQKVSSDPNYMLGREIYKKRILPRLDDPQNRHIQTFNQLNTALGYTDLGFRTFMTNLPFAYISPPDSEGKSKGLSRKSLHEIRQLEMQATDYLMQLALHLGCSSRDIVSYEAWYKAIGDDPSKTLKSAPKYTGKKFNENDLSKESAAVMARIRDAWFSDIEVLTEALNQRVEDEPRISKRNKDDYYIGVEAVGYAISHRVPFPYKGHTDLVYVRITEAVNEKLVTAGDAKCYTVEELFDVPRPALSPRQQITVTAHDNLIRILEQPHNRHFLSLHRVAHTLSYEVEGKRKPRPGSLKDLVALIHTVDEAYSEGAEGQAPVPKPKLQELATVLGCEVADIVPLELWTKAKRMKASPGVKWEEDDADGLPEGFLARSEARDKQRDEQALLTSGRRRILMALRHGYALDRQTAAGATAISDDAPGTTGKIEDATVAGVAISTEEASIARAAVTADSVVNVTSSAEAGIDATVNDATKTDTDIENGTQVINEKSGNADTAQDGEKIVEEVAGQDLAGATSLPASSASPPAATAPALNEVTADFREAALELVVAYRALQSPQTAAELSLLERVEGINRKKNREELSAVAEELGLEENEAGGILADTKNSLIAAVFKKTKIQMTERQAIDALHVYQTDITGRGLLNKYLDAGRDEAKDADIGKGFSRPLSAADVKKVRDNLLTSMAAVFQTPRSSLQS